MWFTTTATEVTIYLNAQKYSHALVHIHTHTMLNSHAAPHNPHTHVLSSTCLQFKPQEHL